MYSFREIRSVRKALLCVLVAMGLVTATASFAAETTMPFKGKTVNGGTVTHDMQGGKHILTLSSDFKVPNSPDPHWQVVDTSGKVHLLDRLTLKDDKVKRSITLPSHIPDIAKVQMWCAWAEVVLGEAPFSKPVMVHAAK